MNIRIKLLILGGLLACTVLSGCANTVNAIKNKDLAVDAKMSDTIFLEAESLADAMKGSGGAVFVRVANTSNFQEVDFKNLLANKLTSMGYNVTPNPKLASYQVTANLLYLDKVKEGMDMSSVVQSGFGGAVVGASIAGLSGSDWHGAGIAGLAGGLLAGAVDGAAGMLWEVEEFVGVTDIQIKETVPGGVEGKEDASYANGIGAVKNTTRTIKTDKQEYRTRIGVSAKQTNIDRNEACNVIADKLASQISGLFKM